MISQIDNDVNNIFKNIQQQIPGITVNIEHDYYINNGN